MYNLYQKMLLYCLIIFSVYVVMYSCNIILKNNFVWVQLKCVDVIIILKYFLIKMIYINNKNNRKLIFSEKVYVSYYICIYV